MTILVTGSSGQVGSCLVEHFRKTGFQVIGIDNRPSLSTDIGGDILDGITIGADSVVHCAAQISVSKSVEEPKVDARPNIEGTLNVLEWARRCDVRMIHFSSAAVYGAPISLPIRENHTTKPSSPYGLSKLTSERYALMYHDLYGLPVTVLRPFNIFSDRTEPGNPYSGVITHFIDRVSQNQPPIIHGDGGQTRDFVHVSDVVQAVMIALQDTTTVGKVFNVGTGQSTSIKELAGLCCQLAGTNLTPEYGSPREGDILHSVADVSALMEHGYTPATDLPRELTVLLNLAGGPMATKD